MKAVGYIRVSTAEQVKHGWNLDEDRDHVKQIADEQGWDLIEVYDDGGKQGDDPDRDGYNAMLADAGGFDVIVMRDLSRLARDPIIHHTAARLFVKADVRVWTFNGPVDLATPEGEFSASVLADVNRLEKRLIGVRVKQMKAARAEAGEHPGGKRPYGYELADTGRRGKNDKVIYELRPHPVERAVVVRMFEMADAGTSQRQIARTLNTEGIPASRGGRWAPSTVNRVLGSPLYLGKLPRRAGTVDGKHEAIVTKALWQRVNRSRATPERRAGGRPMKSGHLLTRGGLRCGSCGSAMIPVASYRGRAETYKCMGRRDHGSGYCQMPPQRRDVIDGALLTELTSRYFDLDGTRDRLRAQIESEVPMPRQPFRTP
jgi:site-specific DNA recombinase